MILDPFWFSLGLAKTIVRSRHILCNERGIPTHLWQVVHLVWDLDALTLICPPDIADEACQILREVLTQDGMILNEDKCIAFSSDGSPPTPPAARRLWFKAKGHNGFIVCGFLSTCDEPTVASPRRLSYRNRPVY